MTVTAANFHFAAQGHPAVIRYVSTNTPC